MHPPTDSSGPHEDDATPVHDMSPFAQRSSGDGGPPPTDWEDETLLDPCPPAGPLGEWRVLAEQLADEAAHATSTRRGAGLHYELGRLYERRLGDLAAAARHYETSIKLQPDFGLATRALARIARQRGDLQGYLKASETELEATRSPEEQAAIFAERAEVRLAHNDLAGARKDLNGALSADSEDPIALDLLADLCIRTGDKHSLMPVLQRQLRQSETQPARAQLYYRLGQVHEALQQPDEADACYRSSVNLDPSHESARLAVLRTSRQRDDYPAVARVAEQLAEQSGNRTGAAYLWEAANAYEEHLRNADQALHTLQSARARNEDVSILAEIARVCDTNRLWSQCCAALESMLALLQTPRSRSMAAQQLARLRSEILDDAAGAVTALEAALQWEPGSARITRTLGRLYDRLQDWKALASLTQRELAVAQRPSHRASLCYRAGILCEERFARPDEAANHYRDALRAQPGYLPAIRGLGRACAALGANEDLVAVYEQQVALVADPADKVSLLERIAQVWDDEIGDPPAALSALERLLALDPTHIGATRMLRRIYAQGNQWADVVDKLRHDAAAAETLARRTALLMEIGTLQERRIDDRTAALQTYLSILNENPTHAPALVAASRLLCVSGQDEQLAQLYRLELDAVPAPDRMQWVSLAYARLLHYRLEKTEDAVLVLENAVSRPDAAETAKQMLLALYSKQGRSRDAAYLASTAQQPSRSEDALVYHYGLALAFLSSREPKEAHRHLRAALQIQPCEPIYGALFRLYAAQEDQRPLAALLQLQLDLSEGTQDQVEAAYRLALSCAAEDRDRAIAALSHSCFANTSDLLVLRLLWTLQSSECDWPAIATTLERLGDAAEAELRDASYALAAQVKAEALDHSDDAARLASAVTKATTTTQTICIRAHRRAKDRTGLLETLAKAQLRDLPPTLRAAELCQRAALHAGGGNFGQACRLYQDALSEDRHYTPATLGWCHAAKRLDDREELAAASYARAEASGVLEHRAAGYWRAAQLWRDAGRTGPRYHEALGRVVAIKPDHLEAIEALSQALIADRQPDSLLDRLEAAANVATSNETKASLLRRMAIIQRDHLDNPRLCQATLARAVELEPNHVDTLQLMADVQSRLEDWEALRNTYVALLEASDDSTARKPTLIALARLLRDQIGDQDAAKTHLRQAVEIDPHDLGLMTELSALLAATKDWLAAAQCTQTLIANDDNRERTRLHHLRLSQIYAKGLDDLTAAIEACRRALALDPGDLEATNHMADLLRRAGQPAVVRAHVESTLNIHRARLTRNPMLVDSYRGLLWGYSQSAEPDRCHVLRSILSGLGESVTSVLEVAGQPEPPKICTPSRALSNTELQSLLAEPERGALHRLLLVVADAFVRTFLDETAVRLNARRASRRSEAKLITAVESLGHLVNAQECAVLVFDEQPEALWVKHARPPRLVVGRMLADNPEDPLTRYRLARALVHLRLAHLQPARFGRKQFAEVMAALLTALVPSYRALLVAERKDGGAQLDILASQLHRQIKKRLRSEAQRWALELTDRAFEPDKWLEAMVQSEDRIALVVCGDVHAAISTLAADAVRRPGSPGAKRRMEALLRFAISEDFYAARQALGISATS